MPCPPAGVTQAGRASTARTVCVCRGVSTERATSLGSASVTLAGPASSATKVSPGLDITASGAGGSSPAHPAWTGEPAWPEAPQVMLLGCLGDGMLLGCHIWAEQVRQPAPAPRLHGKSCHSTSWPWEMEQAGSLPFPCCGWALGNICFPQGFLPLAGGWWTPLLWPQRLLCAMGSALAGQMACTAPSHRADLQHDLLSLHPEACALCGL